MPKALLRSLLRRADGWAEALWGGAAPAAGPVFIIGPPRSGTTLLFQVLTQVYRFAYPTNFQARLGVAPVLGKLLERLIRPLLGAPPDSLTSTYGRTTGALAPNEGAWLWYRWFAREPAPVYTPAGGLDAATVAAMRRTVAALERLEGAPLLSKNVYNSMRVGALAEAFPGAVFLVVRRDVAATAGSILRARRALGVADGDWWSLPPREVDSLRGRPVAAQVAGQVVLTYRQIEADRAAIGGARFLDIAYEGLCADPAGTVAAIGAFLEARGIPVRPRGVAPPPQTAERAAGDPADAAALRDALREFTA